MKTKSITFIGLFTALLCIAAPYSIPIPVSPVPLSLATFIIYLYSNLLGYKKALTCCLIYFLIGLAGIPVFSGFSGGLAKLAGPTGGYLIVYPFMAFIIAFIVEKWGHSCLKYGAAMIVASLVGYAGGTAWLAVSGHISFQAALAAGVLPFVWGDLLKVIFTSVFAGALQKALSHAGLLSVNTAQK